MRRNRIKKRREPGRGAGFSRVTGVALMTAVLASVFTLQGALAKPAGEAQATAQPGAHVQKIRPAGKIDVRKLPRAQRGGRQSSPTSRRQSSRRPRRAPRPAGHNGRARSTLEAHRVGARAVLRSARAADDVPDARKRGREGPVRHPARRWTDAHHRAGEHQRPDLRQSGECRPRLAVRSRLLLPVRGERNWDGPRVHYDAGSSASTLPTSV